MVELYKSLSSGKVHLVQGGYICNGALGKVNQRRTSLFGLGASFQGTRDEITCKNCRMKLN